MGDRAPQGQWEIQASHCPGAEPKTPGSSPQWAKPWILCALSLLLCGISACSGVERGPSEEAGPRIVEGPPILLPALSADAVFAGHGNKLAVHIDRFDRVLRAYLDGKRKLDDRELAALRLRLAELRRRFHDYAGARTCLAPLLGNQSFSDDRTEQESIRALAHMIEARALAGEGAWKKAHAALATALAANPVDRGTAWYLRKAKSDFAEKKKTGATPAAAKASSTTLGSTQILRRHTWGSRKPKTNRMVPLGRPTRLTIHHSALFAGDTRADAIQQVRSIQRNHLRKPGWGDIGYHFLIDRRGDIIEGRSLRYQGAHAGNGSANRHNIGICLLGNFQKVPGGPPAQNPSKAQAAALRRLVAALCRIYKIPASRIFTHQEVHPDGPGATLCPGRRLLPLVRSIRATQRRATIHP